MKIGLVAEGETELGRSVGGDAFESEGVSGEIIRRMIGAEGRREIELVPIKLSRLPADVDRVRQGEDERAYIKFQEARRLGCDSVVLLRDADGAAEHRRTLNELGLTRAASEYPDKLWVLGIQINTLEAWLLADPQAYQAVFRRIPTELPRSPESLWGERGRPTSNHPKRVFERCLRQLDTRPTLDTALRIAQRMDIDTVARACPSGFGRFRNDLSRAFRPFDCVVAADAEMGIGKGNDLPWPRLKHDLSHFRTITSTAAEGMRNAVIMGRKTWDSTPAKHRPLRDRLNIVISRSELNLPDGVHAARSLEHALIRASVPADVDRIFVIGGGEIFAHAFRHFRCRDIYLTRIDHDFDCDVRIPPPEDAFTRVEELARHEDAGFEYVIERWRRSRS